MTSTRRRFLQNGISATAVTLPLFNVLSSRAHAAEFVLKLGNSYQATHPTNLRIKEAGQKIKEESGGRVEVRLFADSQLGQDTQMIEQMRSGALEMMATPLSYMSSLVPAVNVSGLGFAFSNYDQVWSAWDGNYGDFLRKQCPDKIGVFCFEKTFDNGFRQITASTHPVNKPDDLKGMKIRVPAEENKTSLFKHLGAAPATVSIKETYSALQTHVVDAQENGLPHIEFWKFYEVAKYCSLTNHIWDGLSVFINLPTFKRMPATLQEIVARNFDAAALNQRADMLALNQVLIGKIEKWGMKTNSTNPEEFREALRRSGYYQEWRTKLGDEAWHMLEVYTGALG
jgi:tripartite ATP-independent transporter DctP family solute receptor